MWLDVLALIVHIFAEWYVVAVGDWSKADAGRRRRRGCRDTMGRVP
jgi:hypothetical protein